MRRKQSTAVLAVLIIVGAALGCTQPEAAFPTTAATTAAAATAAVVPTAAPEPTIAPAALPVLSLGAGDTYFNIDGKQSFITVRNITGKTQADFDTLLEWAHTGGTRLVRVHLTHGWWGQAWIYKDWSLNEKWAEDWDGFFEQAGADGIYVMPVFGVWADWNSGKPDWGSSDWKYNPLNMANINFVDKGPLTSPGGLFESGSDTQKHWLAWVEALVKRWEGRDNIAAWEIFSEVNIATGAPGNQDAKGGVSEAAGEALTERAMAVIEAADTRHRPVTLSLAGVYSTTDQWAKYYRLDSLDFIEIHPYHDELDRELVKEVKDYQTRYQKPVMIGESGLWSMNYKPNAVVAIRHAIWAGLVSGAMNGRGLWWNDGYAIYEIDDRTAAMKYMNGYADAELPVVKFTEGMDFADFKPLESSSSNGIWGAVVGNQKSVIGWFRDAGSEPPYWSVRPVLSGEGVTISMPSAAGNWQVDFYDTKTGTILPGSVSVTGNGSRVSIPLPDFTDDIAFKARLQE